MAADIPVESQFSLFYLIKTFNVNKTGTGAGI
jgi:hypothetical protein